MTLEHLPFGIIISTVKAAILWVWKWFHRNQRTLSNIERLELRQRWKPIFEEQLWERRRLGLRCDVVIRDMRRLDHYPDVKEGKGISSWFKVGLMGTYHRGILAGLRWGNIIQNPDGKWRSVDYKKGEVGQPILLTGYIPYEAIESVDWDGDEYYGPIIYCHFDYKGEPYEKLMMCREGINPHPGGDIRFYVDVVPYEEVRKTTKKSGIPSSF